MCVMRVWRGRGTGLGTEGAAGEDASQAARPKPTRCVVCLRVRGLCVCVCHDVLTVYVPMQQYLTSACVYALAGVSAVAESCPHEGGARDDAAVSKCQAATHKVRAQLRDVCLRTTCVLVCRCVRAF